MIRKAVIPAAGFGTRFLPAAKSQPKEMLPIVDTPTIQYVVEEAAASGITDILMIIGKGKRSIEEHFDRNFDLEHELAEHAKEEELRAIRRISNLANIHFIWQKELNGLGDAVSYARDHVGNEPFVVLLGDTIIDAATPVTRQLLDIFAQYGESVVALEAVARSKVGRYGVIAGAEVSDTPLSPDGSGGKACARARPLQPGHRRTLLIHRGDLRLYCQHRPRQKRRDSTDGCHAPLALRCGPCMASTSRGRATTSAISSIFSKPTSNSG